MYTEQGITRLADSVRMGTLPDTVEDLHRAQHLAGKECPNPLCRMWRDLFPATGSRPRSPEWTILELSLSEQRLRRLLGTAIDDSNRTGRPALTDQQLDSLEAVTAALVYAAAATEAAITRLTPSASEKGSTDASPL